MLFNSYEFLFVFLPITLLGLYTLSAMGQPAWAVGWTALASLVFYSFWNIAFLWVLGASIALNYALGLALLAMHPPLARKALLTLGLATNLGLLTAYKYSGFAVSIVNDATGASYPLPHMVLPIGISFFTFTQIAFLVDAHRRRVERYPFVKYVLFVAFFPHLVAGPILRHYAVIPQLESSRFGRPSARMAYAGLVFFCCGLFKKVLIADTLAPSVNALYAAAHALAMAEAWLAGLLYTLQLYFDFSGYSDMALGLALLLNVRIPLNFNSPYKSANAIEFWRRWHISLSSFLRDYLYIPLGGNRKGAARQLINIFITMLLCGLWHGAGWTFVAWGGYHGLLLIANHLWRRTGMRLPRVLGWAITFTAVLFGWVLFRAATLHDAVAIFASMAGLHAGNISSILGNDITGIALLAFLLVGWCVLTPGTRYYAIRRRPSVAMAVWFAFLMVLGVINIFKPTEFLYFQF